MEKRFILGTIFPLSILILSFSSCSNSEPDTSFLEGKWDVVYAIRNERATTTLEDAYFQFQPDTTMMTNIFAGDQRYHYSTEEDGIRQEGDPEVFYKIERAQNDTLILSATINDYRFLFVTVKDTSTTVLK